MVLAGGNELLDTNTGPIRDSVATSRTVLPQSPSCLLIMRLLPLTVLSGTWGCLFEVQFSSAPFPCHGDQRDTG